MGSLEIFRIDENGAGWVDFSLATKNEKMDIELGLMTNQMQMLCIKCHKPIPKGNVCETHKEFGIYFD